jgi:NCS1 nucleoside transporter family
MMLYSFVAIFVTCAAAINFRDVLIVNDAPWDPVTLLSRFESKWVVVISQIFMLIATLSTNIAANVIAPSNAFSNLYPKKISFKMGGLITGIIGIICCPWLIMNEISSILIFVSGLLGPVLGIMLSDYFLVRRKNIQLKELYSPNGVYSYFKGFNLVAIFALIAGVGIALIGYYVPSLSALYKLSWFSGFLVSFILYYLLMPKPQLIKVNH